jgi:GTP cyclohydrolase II
MSPVTSVAERHPCFEPLSAPSETASAEAVPAAAVRTSVRVPLRFPDGWETVADVFTFTGLADGK